MSQDAKAIREERKRLRQEYGEIYDRVAALLFEQDPVGIKFHDNTDEYEPEVGTILPRLRACRSANDVQRVVHEELCRWFDPVTAGPFDAYEKIAVEIWSLVRETKWAAPEGIS